MLKLVMWHVIENSIFIQQMLAYYLEGNTIRTEIETIKVRLHFWNSKPANS